MPADLSFSSRPRLKSGTSMPINRSGGFARNVSASLFRIPRISGYLFIDSRPMMESCSMGNRLRQPSACICGPPIPSKEMPGTRALSTRIKPAPRASPDASPATTPMRIFGMVRADSADDAALRCLDEVDKIIYLSAFFSQRRQLRDGLLQQQAGLVEYFERASQRFNGRYGKLPALESADIESMRFGGISRRQQIRGDILECHRGDAGHGVSAHATELMNHGKATEDDIILDGDMPRQAGAVGENRMIADTAVVRDMTIRHDEIVMADPRHTAAGNGAATERAILPDDVTVADLQPGRLALVTQMLGGVPQRRELIDSVVFSDARRSVDHDMRADPGVIADLHARADNAERPEMNVFADYRPWGDNR